jgi:hypothetical protein
MIPLSWIMVLAGALVAFVISLAGAMSTVPHFNQPGGPK